MKYKNLFEEDLPYTINPAGSLHWQRRGGDLTGSPEEVKNSFNCANSEITSLKGCPRKIGRHFIAEENEITNILDVPEYIGGNLTLSENPLKSLETRTPIYVGGILGLYDCQIESLLNINDYFSFIGKSIWISRNHITEGGLGLLLIPGLTHINVAEESNTFFKASMIIKKYLSMDNKEERIYECQAELVDAGLEEFAQI